MKVEVSRNTLLQQSYLSSSNDFMWGEVFYNFIEPVVALMKAGVARNTLSPVLPYEFKHK